MGQCLDEVIPIEGGSIEKGRPSTLRFSDGPSSKVRVSRSYFIIDWEIIHTALLKESMRSSIFVETR